MTRTSILRLVGLLILLLAAGQAFACGITDACTSGQSSDCDQPQGDNCLCCCHHIIPITVFALDPAEHEMGDPPPLPVVAERTVSSHIDHPPQL